MWPSFRGECDPSFCVAGAIVSEPQKDFFHPREWHSRVFLRSNSHFNQLPGRYACYGVPLLYVVTSISSNFQDALDVTFQETFQSTSRTLWMLTSISSNFEDALDVTFQETFQSTSRTLWMLRCTIQFEQLGRRLGCYVPTAISINFQDTIMLRCTIPSCNIHLEQLRRRFGPGHSGCYGVPLLRCNIHVEQLRRRFGCYLPRAISINF